MVAQARFVGFDSKPEWKAHFERMMPELWHEVGRWSNRVQPVFELIGPTSKQPGIRLSLSLKLPNIHGEDSTISSFEDIEDVEDFRRTVRFVWEELLGKMLEERARETEKELEEVTGG